MEMTGVDVKSPHSLFFSYSGHHVGLSFIHSDDLFDNTHFIGTFFLLSLFPIFQNMFPAINTQINYALKLLSGSASKRSCTKIIV